MNYNMPYGHSTMATVPVGALVGGSAEASIGSRRVFVEPRQHVVGQSQIKSLIPAEFRKHETKWTRDTRYSSSLSDKYLHPSYARIIGMGPSVVPLILQRLKQQPNDWFYALRAITGANPVRPGDAGDMQKMAQIWLAWGKKRGLCA